MGPQGPPVELPPAVIPNSVLQRVGSNPIFMAPLTLDQILPAFVVSLSGGGSLELGQTVTNPYFTATYSREPAVATLSIDNGYGLDVSGTPTSFTAFTVLQKSELGSSNAVILTANETGGPSKTSTAYFGWYPKVFVGVGSAGSFNESFIHGLTGALASSRGRTFTVTPGVGQKIYYAYPVAFGLATFYVGGFEGGFIEPPTVTSVTNPFGVVLDYYVYESSQDNLGQTTVLVS